MTDDEVRKLAQMHIDRENSREAWCRKVGLSPSYVFRQMRGIDPIGAKFLKALGLKVTQVTYGERL